MSGTEVLSAEVLPLSNLNGLIVRLEKSSTDPRPDYGHELEFGYFLIPDAGDPAGVLEVARLARGTRGVGARVIYTTGGGAPSALAASVLSQPQTRQACWNAERANSSA
jgi:hypothetical protein